MELEPEDDADDSDLEPSLGSFDRMMNQDKAWRTQSLYAFPAVDGEHDTADDEPALGSLDHHHSQEHWATGGCRDLEADLAESGIAARDGLLEQVGSQDWQRGAFA